MELTVAKESAAASEGSNVVELVIGLVGLLFITIVWFAIHWLIAFPAFLVIATPYVLVASRFGGQPYWTTVMTKYRAICGQFSKLWFNGAVILVHVGRSC